MPETEKEPMRRQQQPKRLRVPLTAKIEAMLEEIKALHSENEKLKSKLAQGGHGRRDGPGAGSKAA